MALASGKMPDSLAYLSFFPIDYANDFNWKRNDCEPTIPPALRKPRRRPLLPAFPAPLAPRASRVFPFPASPALPVPRHSLRFPRSPVPGIPCAPRSRRSSRPPPSARRAPPRGRPLARPRPELLVPPTRPSYWAACRGRERHALPIGGLRSPLRDSPNAGRPRAGIGHESPRPALRSPRAAGGSAVRRELGRPF